MENRAIIINTISAYTQRRMRDRGFDFRSAVHCSSNFLSGSRRENNRAHRKLIWNTHPITRGKKMFGVESGGNVRRGCDVDQKRVG